jgi:hypothetical protein
VITTKGDANKTADPWHARIASPTVDQVIDSVLALGRVLIAARGPGQILLFLLGGFVALWAGTRWILSSSCPLIRRTTDGIV